MEVPDVSPVFDVKGPCHWCSRETGRSLEIIQIFAPDNDEDPFMAIRPMWKRRRHEPVWACEALQCHANLIVMIIKMASQQYVKAVIEEPAKKFPPPGRVTARLSNGSVISGRMEEITVDTEESPPELN